VKSPLIWGPSLGRLASAGRTLSQLASAGYGWDGLRINGVKEK
jgi:hypothetical protein